MRMFLFIILFMLAPANANATDSFRDGNSLHEHCLEDTKFTSGQKAQMSKAGDCMGYVIGIMDAWSLAMEYSKGLPVVFCLPRKLVSAQAMDIVKKYLADHPEERHFSGGSLVVSAISDAFPCPK